MGKVGKRMQQLNLIEDLDEQVKPASGNRRLVDYGIQNEGSDYRAHVCYPIMRVYVFSTQNGRQGLERAKVAGLKPIPVYTNGIVTATGLPVPISWIEDVREIQIPLDIWNRYHIDDFQDTSQKGQRAAFIVFDMLKRNLVPLPVQPSYADSPALQLEGTDITINSELKVQVKCDFKGGDRRYADHNGKPATGNLFLQESECNPYKRH
jgi:hypothetical protein